MKLTILLVLSLLPAFAQYSVQRDNDIVRLVDSKTETIVSIMPAHGNNLFRMTVKGKDVILYPYKSGDEFKSRNTFAGIPFLWPWANRLDDTASYANGKKYALNMDLGVVRGQPGSHPMHGFLAAATQWQVVEAV
jgi:aldose 1-epimerase